jgi:hypothetical protein
MYVLVPTKVSAIELMSSPETPKSQIFICPDELTSTFDGFTSALAQIQLLTNELKDLISGPAHLGG